MNQLSLPQDLPPIRIVIVDNDFSETDIIKTWLDKDMRVSWRMTHFVSVEKARPQINKADLVILKPEMNGIYSPKEVFKHIDDMVFEVPIIVLTSEGDERGLSTYVMEQGAADTLIRGHFARLVDAIEFALIRQRIKTNAREGADKIFSDRKDKSAADLKASQDETLSGDERHKQILRMFLGDYSKDHE